MSLPYYKMYPKDFDADEAVRLMSLAELGLFLCCLNTAWANDGLPSDPDSIRVVATRVSLAEFRKLWPKIEPAFPVSKDGRRRNPRQEKERGEAMTKRYKATLAGKESARVRSTSVERPLNDGSISVELRGYNYDANAVEISKNLKPEKSEDPSAILAFDELWPRFVQSYRETGKPLIPFDFTEASWVWRMLDLSQKLQVLQHVRGMIDGGFWSEPRYIPKPANYLKNREYTRPLPVVKTMEQRILEA